VLKFAAGLAASPLARTDRANTEAATAAKQFAALVGVHRDRSVTAGKTAGGIQNDAFLRARVAVCAQILKDGRLTASGSDAIANALQNGGGQSRRSERRRADVSRLGQAIEAAIDRALSLCRVVYHIELAVALVSSPVPRAIERENRGPNARTHSLQAEASNRCQKESWP
jgi:hypothetical protein